VIRLPLDEIAVRRLLARMRRTAAMHRSAASMGFANYVEGDRVRAVARQVADDLATVERWARRYCPGALKPRKR
jgi:transposase